MLNEDVNFSIVENSPSVLEDTVLYTNFIDYYNDSSMTTKEIRERLDLTPKKYALLREKALLEHKVVDRDNKVNNVCYYTETDYGFVVKKLVNKKMTYYGTYDTEEIAQEIVCRLKEIDWDKKELENIKCEVLR